MTTRRNGFTITVRHLANVLDVDIDLDGGMDIYHVVPIAKDWIAAHLRNHLDDDILRELTAKLKAATDDLAGALADVARHPAP